MAIVERLRFSFHAAKPAGARGLLQEVDELIRLPTLLRDDEHGHLLPRLERDLRCASKLRLDVALHVDRLPELAHWHRHRVVEGRPLTRLQERRHLEKRCAIRLLQEVPLGLAADGAAESKNSEVLPENAGPGHDEHAFLE